MPANLSDIFGATTIGVLFLAVLYFVSTGKRKIHDQLSQHSQKLKSKGLQVTSSGIKIETNLDLTQDELIQRASHGAQVIKHKLTNDPKLIIHLQPTKKTSTPNDPH
ncbi:hypothetical protein O181_043230 [Austropuccinia psidii MF-1]|uniref:Uncharacterized protein n=1 Tax=Austropuccinia psidii MF-1 TaxID=1389203 RepID=A0A9Q3HIY4_9BASI|nr:hypothetical protein [Austropuccinia psidii MF-1]